MTDCIGLVIAFAFGSASPQVPQGVTETTRTQPPVQSQQAPLPVFTDRIEVVATRLAEVPGEVAAPVEVLSGDDLRARGVTDLAGALALAAGVDVAPGGDAGPAGGHIHLVAGADFTHGLGDAEGADFLYTVPLDGSYVPVANEPDTLDVRIRAARPG